jgi:hypothetical protein
VIKEGKIGLKRRKQGESGLGRGNEGFETGLNRTEMNI